MSAPRVFMLGDCVDVGHVTHEENKRLCRKSF